MRISDDLYVLPLGVERGGQISYFNVSLIADPAAGHSLVDTGLPGQIDTIIAALGEDGFTLGDLRRVIITHQDWDHIGSLHDVVQATGAPVLASSVEAPTIDGRELPRFARPETLAQRPELRAAAAAFKPTPIDEELQDGALLNLAGGLRVILTPGHTPGHMSLYLERSRALIAGDALTASEGRLSGPNPQATQDMSLATESVRRMAALDVATIICYHGGLVSDDANGQLRRVLGELSSEQ